MASDGQSGVVARVGVAIDYPGPADIVTRTIRCVAGIEFLAAPLDRLGELSKYDMLVVDRGSAALLRAYLPEMPQTRIIVVAEDLDDEMLDLAQKQHSLAGLLLVPEIGPRSWELTYMMRRLTNPDEPPPMLGALLAWGATSMSWMPANTSQQRRMVDLVERACVSLGIDRRVADVIGTAAHELSMNAMFAPVDASGAHRELPGRDEELVLTAAEIPELRLTVDGALISLDCVDHFGHLSRNAFFESIARGRRSTLRDEATSTRGAGLGLHTLFAAGSLLRAEVIAGEMTVVSWAYDRSRTGRTRRQTPRSLWFL